MSDKFSYACINPYAFLMLNLDFDLRQQKEKKNKATPLAGHPKTRLCKLLRNVALLICGFAAVAKAQQTHVVTSLANSGAGSLRDKIINSSDGDTITFSPALLANGSATISLASSIDFNHSLTIKGLFVGTDSLAISGMNTNRVFNVEASSNLAYTHIHLQDLIIKNGWHTSSDYYLHYTNGGAIYMAGLEKLSLENVIMRDNHAKGEASGGAMFLYDNDTVTLKRCQFKGNTTDTTASGGSFANGGALSVWQGVLMVDDCTFLYNKSKHRGGAIRRNSGTLIIENSLFKANEVRGLGGAVYTYNMDTVIIGHSDFIDNKAKTSSGGALYLYISGATVYKSFFKGNKAFKEGGGISSNPFYSNDPKNIYIIECTLDSNVAEHGGAIYLMVGNYNVVKCYIHNNTATQGGGAIYGVQSEIKVLNSTVTDNKGANGGSAFKLYNAKTSIVNSTIVGTPYKDLISLYPTSHDTLLLQSSILVAVGGNYNIKHNNHHTIQSRGHNLFSDNGSFVSGGVSSYYRVPSDQLNISPQMLDLKPPDLYGGITLCQPPNPGSPAYNAGNPNDFSDAQNGSVFNVRDCGAAEAQVIATDTALLCGQYQWWGHTYTKTGFYTDTAYNTHTLDSIGQLYLLGQDSLVIIQNGKLMAPQRDSNTTYQWVYCDSGYAPISGATDSVFQPITNGTYAVVMTQPGCQDTSDCIRYNQVGIPEYARLRHFVQFYPNPSTGKIQIESPDDNRVASLKVYDLQGRLLATIRIQGPEIDLKPLPAGVYLLEWHSEKGGFQRDRIVIE